MKHRQFYFDTQLDTSPVRVFCTYYPASRGSRDSLGGVRGAGPPLEPDEPACIEVDSVKGIESGQEYELGQEDIDSLGQEAWNHYLSEKP